MITQKLKTAGQTASKLFRTCMAGTILAGSVAATWIPMTTTASAADSDVASTEQAASDDSRLVRLGLNKSAVIKLPSDAHDVVVGNSDIVDAVLRKKDTIYLFARQSGQTNIFVFDRDGQQILAIDFEVVLDTLPLKKLLQRSIPGNQIKIDTVNSNIVLAGKARNAEEAKLALDLATRFSSAGGGGDSVINAMTILGENQVMLKVKVVEIQRDIIKQLGVDLQAALSVGEFAFNLASVNPFANALVSPLGGSRVSDNIGKQRFDSMIRAMESDGLTRTLAEPNLTAVSGQPASFLAGGEFPYRTCTTNPVGVICTTSFKPFGIKLNFTPVVMNENRINLKIATEVSEIGTVTDGIPALNQRNATTTLEMASGSSMMIAGLIRENTRQNLSGTPGLKKLPVLGSLFRSRDFISNESELVVIVTPLLVKPVSEKQLETPDKNFVPSSDREAIFMGKMHKVYDRSGKVPNGHYTGSVGHIVE
jgi:pilus assembly protein CpaC